MQKESYLKNNSASYVLKIIALFLLYFFSSKLGIFLSPNLPIATHIWLPTGISLAFLIIFGIRFWPAIALASLCVNIENHVNIISSVGIACGDTIEAVIGAYLLNKVHFQKSLNRTQDVFKYIIIISFISTLVGSIIGVLSLSATQLVTQDSLLFTWKTLWLRNIMSDLVIGSFILIWSNKLDPLITGKTLWKKFEALLLIVIVIVTSFYIFLEPSTPIFNYSKTIFILPPLIWAAFRFGQKGAITAILLIRIISYIATAANFSHLPSDSILDSMQALQFFIGTITISLLILASAIKEKTMANTLLNQTLESLEDTVRVRTAELENEIKQSKKIENERSRFFLLSQDLIVTKDFDGFFKEVNPACERILGYSTQELLKMCFLEIVHPEDVPLIKKALQDLNKGQSVYSLPFRFRCKNGSYREFLTSATPLIEQRCIYSVSKDITEYKHSQEALENNKYRLSLVLEAANMGAWDLDLKTHIATRTRLHDVIFGYDEIVPEWTLETSFKHILSKDKSYIQCALSEALTTGTLDVKFRIIRKNDHALRWVAAKGRIFRNEKNVPVTMMGVIYDITERKQIEEKLISTNEELNQFAYMVSHDLQEPLRMITSYLQLLEKKYKNQLDKDSNDFIEYAINGATTMKRLITDLLTYARLGKDETLQNIDTNEVLNEALINLQVTIRESNAVINSEGLPVIKAPRLQFMLLLQNLIGNAIKFRKKDTPPVITVNANRNEDEWVFSVHDNGIGIEAQYFERIFKISQRLHSVNEYPGTGLGLSICKKIVERLGGHIWVESKPDKGSTFYFTIPHHIIGE